MKRTIAMLSFLTLAAIAVAAQSVDLGDFPKGKWIDEKWNAVWEFGADNIRILDPSGTVVYDFKDRISDFKVDVGLTEAKVSFTCKDAGRKYVFTKGIKDLDLVMTIDPDWSSEDYRVSMPLRK